MDFSYITKKILLFPVDSIVALCGVIPPSYYSDVRHEAFLDANRFRKNEEECYKKYGMSMLEKIRSVEKEIKGEEFKKTEIDCATYMDQWCHLELFHDMMCRTEGMFDSLLEEYSSQWKFEIKQTNAMKIETEYIKKLISEGKVTRDSLYESWCRAWLLDKSTSKEKWNDYCLKNGKSKEMLFDNKYGVQRQA